MKFLRWDRDGIPGQRAVARLRIGSEQRDDPIGDVGLAGSPICLGHVVQRTGNDGLDVPGERGVRLGGVEGYDACDNGAVALEGVQFGLEGARDQAFVEAECQRRHGEPGYSRCAED